MIKIIRSLIPNWLINRFWHWPQAVLANIYYDFPSRKLKIIGVTGTKGKTTTCHLIYHILKENGHKTVLISTIGAFFGEKEIDTGLHVTNPDPLALQKLLRQVVSKKFEYVIMEVTSNGLDQFRDWGIKFKLGVFTQITSDHLDYHGSLENYRRAKAILIENSQQVLFNKHDPSLVYLTKFAQGHYIPFKIYAGQKENFQNQNIVAAVQTAHILGISEEAILKAIKTFPGVSGRMETVYDKDFQIIIDFTHTPDSLRAVLTQLRQSMPADKKLIAVFGCAGERDHARRRMGAVAAKLADFFIITAEDPRSESVEKISDEIATYAIEAGANEISGKEHPWEFKDVPYKVQFIRIPDRQEAINYAIKIAKPGDVIGLFGKGHEKSMCYGNIEKPWNEHQAVKKALINKQNIEI